MENVDVKVDSKYKPLMMCDLFETIDYFTTFEKNLLIVYIEMS